MLGNGRFIYKEESIEKINNIYDKLMDLIANNLAEVIILAIVTIGLLVAMTFASRRYYKTLNKNYQLIAQLLQSAIKKEYFGNKTVFGYYKERNIIWQSNFVIMALPSLFIEDYDIYSWPGRPCFYVNLNKTPETKSSKFSSRPTKNTILQHGKRRILYITLWNELTEQVVIDIFEELIRAAEIVEGTAMLNEKRT